MVLALFSLNYKEIIYGMGQDQGHFIKKGFPQNCNLLIYFGKKKPNKIKGLEGNLKMLKFQIWNTFW